MANNSDSNVSVSITSAMSNSIVYVCIRMVMPCAVAIGIIGNLLSILVFSRREMIKFCVSIFTIVLALSDILLLITSLFNIILPHRLGGPLSDTSAFWCHFHGYFDLLFAALSGYSMVFISVERWFSVWKPFDKAKYVTFKTALIAVASYTIVSLIAFSWFPFALSYNPQKPEPRERCQLQRPTVYKVFGTISVIFTYIAPFIVLGILNFLIVYRLRARQHTSIHRSMVSASGSNSVDPTLGSSTRKRHRQRNTDRNITFMLIAVAVAFMVMSFPFQIYWFYMQIRQLTEPDTTLFTLTQTFRYLNCCCNFFLYSATSSLFRRELREIFQCSTLSKVQRKQINIQKTTTRTEATRLRALSTPPPYSKTIDDSAIERKKLLTTATSSFSSMKPVIDASLSTHSAATVENLCLISTSPDLHNGHIVSFKK